jgi:hypothetical protein
VECVGLLGRMKIELRKLVGFFDSLGRLVSMMRNVYVPQFIEAITAEASGRDEKDVDHVRDALTYTGQQVWLLARSSSINTDHLLDDIQKRCHDPRVFWCIHRCCHRMVHIVKRQYHARGGTL